MIYGLASALSWGIADFLGAVVSRRIGSFATVVIGQLAGLIALSGVVLAGSPDLSAIGASDVGWLLFAGASVAIAYLAFYRGLQLGPIALVSPIGAGYGAVSVVLAVVFLHEALDGWSGVGVSMALVGILLTSRNPRTMPVSGPVTREGVPYAVVAMVGFGISAFTVGIFSKSLGWGPAVIVARSGTVATLVIAAIVVSRGGRTRHPVGGIAFAVVVGLLDATAFAAYARASEVGLISIAAAVSATYPVVPILAGVAAFREVIVPSQWLGIVSVIGGLVLLGLNA